MVDPVFHATVLSNFARAFDKYARAYDKRRIPESRHPAEFYVLPRRELATGAKKAAALRDRLALPNDAIIALRATPLRELAPNARTGVGLVWPSPVLPLEAVHDLGDDGALGPVLSVEEATARSLELHAAGFIGYDQLRPRSLSFLPIARGCQAACSFCFSEASVSHAQPAGKLDVVAARRWARAAARRGAQRGVITGGGEPTLLRRADLLALIEACRAHLPKVVLITNGVALLDRAPERLRELRDAGLTVLAVSRHHPDERRNAEMMKVSNDISAIAAARPDGLRLRLVCVLQHPGVEGIDAVEEYVAWASAIGAEEVCFKELYVSTSRESVYHSREANVWSAAHQVPLSCVLAWAARAGFSEESQLPWGAPIFAGRVGGRAIRVAAYTEPSLFWERLHGVARSWNVMADGACLASLEDRQSRVTLPPEAPDEA